MRGPVFAAVLFVASVTPIAELPARADPVSVHEDTPPDESFSEYVPGAARLEGRLLSPCCWNENGAQTLDVHRSPIANELRREIRSRLKAGETPDAIEADMVQRYGTKILAVPRDNPLPRVGPFLIAGLLLGLVVAGRTVSRWRHRGAVSPAPAPAPAAGSPDEWDRRLDAELQDPE